MEYSCEIVGTDAEEEQQHRSYAMQLASSSVLPMVLLAVVDLQVLEIIAKAGPGARLSASEIVSQMAAVRNPEAPTMLDRMLRLLVTHSVLTCSFQEDGKSMDKLYGLAPVAKYFIRKRDAASVSSLMSMIQDKVVMESWYELKAAVSEGETPFNRVHGMHVFEYTDKDPMFNEVFNKAMIDCTTMVVTKILESYKGFDHLENVVDVGGGVGVTLKMIISKYPNIKGVNFDLPQVIQHALPYHGVQHVSGNMFDSVPKGDAIFMKSILHSWRDDLCLKLLKNCYEALPEKGKVIAVEWALPVTPDTSAAAKFVCQLDCLIMSHSVGGKERNQHEYRALATEAGFSGFTVERFAWDYWVMEFHK